MQTTREIKRTWTEKCRYGLGDFEMREIRSYIFDGWYVTERQVVNGITWNVYNYPVDSADGRRRVPAAFHAEFMAAHLDVNPFYPGVRRTGGAR